MSLSSHCLNNILSLFRGLNGGICNTYVGLGGIAIFISAGILCRDISIYRGIYSRLLSEGLTVLLGCLDFCNNFGFQVPGSCLLVVAIT